MIELAGIGPAPFCGMLLADLGADVVRVERSAGRPGEAPSADSLLRNRRSIALNLKNAQAVEVLLSLVAGAEILIEGFRPGVTEKLGIGPAPCLERNPRLVYGRMTGWGQDGPLAMTAGHDINYIALAGALHLIGRPGGKPTPPLCLVGDFGGGGMLLAFGLLAALLEARQSGRGQVVDAAMIDGAITMMGIFYAMRREGVVQDATGENVLAGAAPWYDTYRTKDGRYVAVGAMEPPFFRRLLQRIGLDVEHFVSLGHPAVNDSTRRTWPELRAAMTAAFATRTRDEWCAIMEGQDTCFAPVLSLSEAPAHPHIAARRAFIEVDGVEQNAPAPRFSRSAPGPVRGPAWPGEHTDAVLAEAGFPPEAIAALRSSGALG